MSVRLSAWLPAYQRDLRTALQLAAQQRFALVHADTARSDLRPADFSNSARRHLRKVLADLGLGLDTLTADFPGRGLCDPALADQRVAHFRQTLELCADLGVRHAGVTLAGLEDPQHKELAHELLHVVADLSDRFGITVAVQDSSVAIDRLAETLRGLACPTLRAGIDSATLAGAQPPMAQVSGLLGDVHLRDVRRRGGQLEEVPFGQGEVDFAQLVSLPDVLGEQAALVVKPESRAGVDALQQGREYMRALLGGLTGG